MLTGSEFEAIRTDGEWDPSINAYRVVNADKETTRYFTLHRPPLILDAIAVAAATLFWAFVAVFLLSLFVDWPRRVDGDRQSQLSQALYDRYLVHASHLPERWTATQVLTVDLTQSWDNPAYDKPPLRYEDCKLQPGKTVEELDLRCPSDSGAYEEPRVGGGDAAADRRVQSYLESTDTVEELNSEPDYSGVPDRTDYYYEPQEMFP